MFQALRSRVIGKGQTYLSSRPWRGNVAATVFGPGHSVRRSGGGVEAERSTGPGTFDVLGVPIAITTPDLAARKIETWAGDGVGRYVCMRDVTSLMMIVGDPALASIHQQAAMITPDGMPLAVIGKIRGLPVARTCGPDLMDLLISRSVESGLRHYFYGGKPGVAEQLAGVFSRKYPGIQTAGFESPPFVSLTEAEDCEATARIAASGADIVWVGMSSPKQDIWMLDHYRTLPQTLIGVGAAFDFHSGAVKRAPRWLQVLMLEWAFRVWQEPGRLWRRYVFQVPKFLIRMLVSTVAGRS